MSLCRQSWPTRVDVHQDVSDGLGGPAISHPGGPQSPARSAESLHKGPRPKTALLDLSQRQESSCTRSSSLQQQQQQQGVRQNQDRGLRPLTKPHPNPLRLGSLTSAGPCKPRSPSLFSVEEDEEGEGGEDKCLPSLVVLRCKTSSASPSASSSAASRLTSRMSAPVLNQIHEEEKEDEEEEEEEAEGELRGPKPSLSLNLDSRITSAPNSSAAAAATPGSETSDEETESQRRLVAANAADADGERKEERKRRRVSSSCTSPVSGQGQGQGQGRGTAKATNGLVESLKLMSLCLSSQFHNLTTGGSGGGSAVSGVGGATVAGDNQERPMWRMCMGGSTGSLDKVSLLGGSGGGGGGGPSPRGNLYRQRPPAGDALADPLLEGPCGATLRLGELDLARENQRNMKNRVLQMPLSDKTLSVNIHRSPKEGLLCTPTPHSCCQVI